MNMTEKELKQRIMETRIEKVKKVIEDNFQDCGLFFSRNTVGDYLETIYDDCGVIVDVCEGYGYFEVFGLTREEQETLSDWYDEKVEQLRK